MMEADGATLFAVTARSVQPAFVLDDTTRPQVAAICARVGGMPLAIELAASWADTLSPAEIAAELGQGDELLATQAQDVPERHRSVRAVCDATWSRLTLQEQAVFAQVAIFRGGGTRQALQAVTKASLGQLHALVGKALLRYDLERERYSVHELLRQYAAERLGADAEARRGAQERHAAYYLDQLAAREVELKGTGQQEALDRIGRDIENIHAAWRWAAEHVAFSLLAPAVGALSLAYEWLGRSEDGLAAMRTAVAAVAVAPTAPAALHIILLAAQARFAFLRGARKEALALLTQAQELLSIKAGAATDLAYAEVLLQLGRCTASQDFAIAQEAYTRSQAIFEACGDQWGVAHALAGLGLLTTILYPNYAAARIALEQSVARFRALGEQIGPSEALINLSVVTRYLSYQTESLALSREAYALAWASGNPRSIAPATSNLGAALCWNGANEEAYEVLRTALAFAVEIGDRFALPSIYSRWGTVTKFLGRYAEARTILNRGLTLAYQIDSATDICAILSELSSTALAEGAYHEALRLAEEVILRGAQLGEGWSRLVGFAASAMAARGLGEVARAQADAIAGLRLMLATHSLVEWQLWAVALLQMDSGELTRAAAMIALAEKVKPINNRWVEDIGLRDLRAALATLPLDQRVAAEVRWAKQDFFSGLAEVITELEAEGWG